MSALQLTWLTNHYEQGKITPDEFTSLYRRIAQTEKQLRLQKCPELKVAEFPKVPNRKPVESKSLNESDQKKFSISQLHPATRRALVRVRSFKKLVQVMNYLIALFIVSTVYLSMEYYKVSGSLPSINLAGLEQLFTQTPRKPLPSDLKLAAEFLADQSDWYDDHVIQFAENWRNTLLSDRQQYSNEHWFHGFKLALSLHIAEQRYLAKSGDSHAIQHTVLLTQLAEQLEQNS